jgi:hypothetical protein
MDYQALFNITITLLGFLGGFILKIIWQTIKDIQDKLSHVEVVVAGNYATKDELNKQFDGIYHKLDLIDIKLDSKVSRGEKLC